MSKMTNDELNRKIVEINGGCWHDYKNDHSNWLDGICSVCNKPYAKNPDYCSSRDLCAELIKKMPLHQKNHCYTLLSDLVGYDGEDSDLYEGVSEFLADPRLWAEAYYEAKKGK